MSELPIDSLPEEILIEIFKLLDLKTLKEVVLTCKRWRDIAEQYVPWSLQLYLYGPLGRAQIMKESGTILESKRNYTTFIVDCFSLGNDRMEQDCWYRTMAILVKIGPNIVTLRLYRSYFEDAKGTIDFFNLMPNVKKVILFNTQARIYGTKIKTPPSFTKLKELEFIWSDNHILKVFKEAELTSFKSLNLYGDDPVKRFLATQKSLKTLALRLLGEYLFEAPIPDEEIPFKLTELSLVDIKLDESPNGFKSLLKFMSLQRTTIEKLELSSKLPDFIFEYVFAEFKNLKSLRLKADTMPTNTEFFGRLKGNESVTTLTLVGKADPSISQLFKHLPNIEHIELQEESNNQTLKSIAENLKKLKHLKVKRFNGSLFGGLNFPTVKALSIESVVEIEWELFAKQAPNITHLFINDLYGDHSGHVNIKKVMESFKVESLTINSKVLADEEFFAVIRTYGSSLKSLSLSSRSLATKERSTEVANVRGLTFHEHSVKDPLSTGNGACNKESHGYLFRLPGVFFI